MRHKHWIGAASAVAGLILFTAVSSAAVCPSDPPGTRTLLVAGHVEGYALRNTAVAVVVRSKRGCEETSVWRPFAGGAVQTPQPVRVECGAPHESSLGESVVVPETPMVPPRAREGARSAVLGTDGFIDVYRGKTRTRRISRVETTPILKIALSGDRVAVLAASSTDPDRPYRLEGYGIRSGRLLFDWPLLGRPATLDLHGDIALFASRNAGGVFALRLSDGRTTNLGPVQPGDTPQIGPHGLASRATSTSATTGRAASS